MTVDTVTCDKQIGCVILQEQPDGTTKLIGYWSRSLNDAEHRYETTHRECLAFMWALLLLRTYLEGARLKIRTEQDSLR